MLTETVDDDRKDTDVDRSTDDAVNEQVAKDLGAEDSHFQLQSSAASVCCPACGHRRHRRLTHVVRFVQHLVLGGGTGELASVFVLGKAELEHADAPRRGRPSLRRDPWPGTNSCT
jgi:hypothetical protein